MNKNFDVIVIGAGAGGLICAIEVSVKINKIIFNEGLIFTHRCISGL